MLHPVSHANITIAFLAIHVHMITGNSNLFDKFICPKHLCSRIKIKDVVGKIKIRDNVCVVKGPVLFIMLHAPLLLFWFAQEQGFYCSEVCEA